MTDKKRHKKLSFFLLIYNLKFCYNSNCFIFVPLIDYFVTLIDYCNRKMFKVNNLNTIIISQNVFYEENYLTIIVINGLLQ